MRTTKDRIVERIKAMPQPLNAILWRVFTTDTYYVLELPGGKEREFSEGLVYHDSMREVLELCRIVSVRVEDAKLDEVRMRDRFHLSRPEMPMLGFAVRVLNVRTHACYAYPRLLKLFKTMGWDRTERLVNKIRRGR